MNVILRIMYRDRIMDYDLSKQKSQIEEGKFIAVPHNGRWAYRMGQASGYLKAGDTILIDKEKRIAAFVVEKLPENPLYIEMKSGLTFGRKTGNAVMMEDKTLSGSHCMLQEKADGWYLRDLGSTNGTYINNRRVQEVKLNEGDILKLGRYIFRVQKRKLLLTNVDSRVTFQTETSGPSARDLFKEKPYPWFSPAPRMYADLEALHINIESAPSIGDKPKMGMGMIALDPAMMAMSLGTQALRYGLSKRKYSKQEKQRAEVYAEYLTDIEIQLQEYDKKQKSYGNKLYPTLKECMMRVNGPAANLWERHPGDADFLSLRFGTGSRKSKAVINIPQQRLQLQENELDKVPQQIQEKYAIVKNLPITASLMEHGNLGILGERNRAVSVAHNMAVQIAALHNYEDVKIIVLYPEIEKEKWQWMRWLPHCMSDDRQQRYMASDRNAKAVLESLEKMVEERIESRNQWSFGRQTANMPHLVFLVAAPELLNNTAIGKALVMNQPELGVSGIFVGSRMVDFPHTVRSVCEVSGNIAAVNVRLKADGQELAIDKNDSMFSVKELEAFARQMAPIRMKGVSSKQERLPESISLLEGLQIADPVKIDFGDLWRDTLPEKSLAVPIGACVDGSPFFFDIHEKKHGPHGMVAGMPGSGKSQMAQTWVASMAMQFAPSDVNFVLVDFKGESLLQPFEKLPHLAGSISNLDHDVARSFSAMESELERRQSLLAEYKCKDIIDYLKKRRNHPQMPELPYLILIVDEFAEFKTQFPGFSKSLDHMYRGGRSLGFFVVLMTQAPSGIVTEQMKASSNFNWCMRVKSDGDSREMLGTTDAKELRVPGRAYVKAGDTYELIQTYFAGADYKKEQKHQAVKEERVYTVSLDGKRKEFSVSKEEKNFSGKTELDALVDAISEYCRINRIPSAKQVWQKELPNKLELFERAEQGMRWNGAVTPEEGPKAVLGVVDDPANQSQKTMFHNFWEDGSIAVYGMPLSGKTTFLQNMQMSLCYKYTPEQVQFYSIDIGGFGLRALETFPHVGGAAGDDEPDTIDAILNLLLAELDRRKKMFRKVGAGSPGMYADAAGEVLPTIVLMVDNLNQAGMQFPGMNTAVQRITREGSAYGIYLACSFSGTVGISYQLIQNIKTSYALELSDKTDYNSIVGRPGDTLPKGVRGRGLMRGESEPLLFQTTVPYADLSDSKRIMALRRDAEEMAKEWKGKVPESIQSVPEEIPFGSVDGEPLVLGAAIEDGKSVSFSLKENVSLLISDGAGVKTDILASLSKQAEALPNSRVCVFTKTDEMEQVVADTVQELRNRQAELKCNPGAVFDPIFFILDGYYDLTSNCKNDTISRLEVFIRLGKGLGIFVIGIDSAEKMSKCRFRGDILTVTMQQNILILCGGTMNHHQIADVHKLQGKYTKALDGTEAVMIDAKKKDRHFRRMQGE